MSSYDVREEHMYGDYHGIMNPQYCNNPYILEWWTSKHDQALSLQIEEGQWTWYCGITHKIVAITPPEVIERWRQKDPLCSRYAWYNILMHFSISRAGSLGLTKHIRKPKWKICPLCNQKFVEDSLPDPLVKRLGIDHLDFCSPCLKEKVCQNTGDHNMPREEVLIYLRKLAEVLGRIPPQGFGEGIDDFRGLDFQERLALLRVLKNKPSTFRVKKLFRSWLKALIEAELLEDGTRKTSRGIQCLARDGHVCFSLGEKTIDDYLYSSGIPHEKEPPYPEGNFRADFSVNGIFIEYFGLKGNPEYDSKISLKKKICKRHNIKMIAIYPTDLITGNKLKNKLKLKQGVGVESFLFTIEAGSAEVIR